MNLVYLELEMTVVGMVIGICLSIIGMAVVQWKLSNMTLKEFFKGADNGDPEIY
ncbi:hypothetical protein [Oenococcus oeni]|uniref:hypothetical protein n=1 Tax=Oenococcus oeni TaxID=1247 RepID=UPI000277B91B|nr:hypothetical protein [Oenococcus oeni]EJO02692.1 hypothetical protein AWRIB418_590 [Oenococcus oeni AWRIB418]USO98868.1 hypothetical protein LOD97_06580 [Oenococcus oeni]USO98922.1 hypothetical protein LOD97_06855 [Oenococcus oeni]USO98976.1 hypothetical protein LOD97_07130 [Oenococcus oeni]USO99030.1 hypothetical protein LOD97_07405 [Oenococcus oeni]